MRLKYLRLRRGENYDLKRGAPDPMLREYRAPSVEMELRDGVVTITGEHEVLVLPFSAAEYALAEPAVPAAKQRGKR